MRKHELGEQLSRILKEDGKSQTWIANNLGISKSTFSKYLSIGDNAIPPQSLSTFCSFFRLEPFEIAELFHIAIQQYPENATAYQALAARKRTTIKPSSLSLGFAKSYHTFFGRTEQLHTIVDALLSKQGPKIIEIVGLGGIGKTSLAQEIVHQCVEKEAFTNVVWKSAKRDLFLGGKILSTTDSQQAAFEEFDDILMEIARACGQFQLIKASSEVRLNEIQNFLAENSVLIVLDNLETVDNNVYLVEQLHAILGISKLLITTRHHINHPQSQLVTLLGLDKKSSIDFLLSEATFKGIPSLSQASEETLEEIYEITEGAPLAMKLVVGQVYNLDLSKVLEHLQQAKYQGIDYDFYRFIYQYSWSLLESEGQLNAQKTLVDMSRFPPKSGGQEMIVRNTSELSEEEFDSAIMQLTNLSLVEVSTSLENKRYALHALTQYFVKSDITKEWQFPKP